MKKKVMIVEDHEDTRTMMRIILELCGYDVLTAGNGSDALETAKQYHPDMILMDLTMPVMDGLTATRLIRQYDEYLASIPIVAITGDGQTRTRLAVESGCNRVLQKPINFDDLRPLLASYLSQ